MKRTVLVVGDVMLDVRRYGTSTRTSPEDPRCRVLNLENTIQELGGAGNVARWLAAQSDLDVEFMCRLGGDQAGRDVHRLCAEAGIRLVPAFCDRTTVKERICLINERGTQIEQMVRVDQDSQDNLSKHNLDYLRRILRASEYDAIVVADYGKEVFDGMFGEILRNEIGTESTVTIVNAKDPSRWEGRWLKYLICNDKEALKTWGPLTDYEVVQKSLAHYFVRTRGEFGVSMCARWGRTFNHPTMVDQVVDVTGAGDAFTAGFAHALVTEGWLHPDDQKRALARGSLWAASCCTQIGCGFPFVQPSGQEEYNGTDARVGSDRQAGV
jgi:rfaE bifunctional protein kinase chain/domain